MYRHILVPTDGSARASAAGRIAARLAGVLHARMTALYVVAEGVPTVFSGAKLYGSGVLGRQMRGLVKAEARDALALVERHARREGVACSALSRTARHPWRVIVATARARKCDLIVMASHGRGGVGSVLLGSQTVRVLAHSKVPVLVCR